MKTLIAALALSLLLAGCAGLTGLSAQWETAVGCQTYASALSTLATFKSKLTTAQVKEVDFVRGVASPICSGDKPVVDATASVVALRDSLRRLVKIQQEVPK